MSNDRTKIDLPPFTTSKSDISKAKWGKLSGTYLVDTVYSSYQSVIKWKRNIFQVPSGKAGKAFIEELSKTIKLFTSSSNLEEVALTMTMIMPPLLLQKPAKKIKM